MGRFGVVLIDGFKPFADGMAVAPAHRASVGAPGIYGLPDGFGTGFGVEAMLVHPRVRGMFEEVAFEAVW